MKKQKINLVFLIVVFAAFLINGFIAFSIAQVPNSPTNIFLKVVGILPEKTKDSKLFRIIDTEAGVVCYIIQNDTADFYSGLQCMPISQTLLGGKIYGDHM